MYEYSLKVLKLINMDDIEAFILSQISTCLFQYIKLRLTVNVYYPISRSRSFSSTPF
jgi:hypothetical protein